METTRLQLVLSEPLPVPDTGRFVGISGGATENIAMILLAIFAIAIVVGFVIYLISRKKGKIIIPVVALALIISAASLNTGKSLAANGYATISVPETVTMEAEKTEETFVSGKVAVKMQDATAYGYDLYTLISDGDLNFVPESADNETIIAPINEQGALAANTWGFTLEADAAAEDEVWYPLSDAATVIGSYSGATVADETTDVYFGVLLNEAAEIDIYTLDVDFYSVVSLADTFDQAFAAAGVSEYGDTGYYAMQSMTSEICADVITPVSTATTVPETQLVDTRDGSVYWVAKLADGGCWMTQNLDLLIDSSKTYTHDDTDLGWTEGIATAVWTPSGTLATVVTVGEEDTNEGENVYAVNNWSENGKVPYQMEGGDRYNGYASLAGCISSGYTEEQCEHYHDGNYYNWSAAVAENDTSSATANYTVMPDSICPAGWRLPNGLTNDNGTILATDYNTMFYENAVATSLTTSQNISVGIVSGNEKRLGSEPIYFARSGQVYGGYVDWGGTNGYYWTSTVNSSNYAYLVSFSWNSNGATNLVPARTSSRYYGRTVRCVAR